MMDGDRMKKILVVEDDKYISDMLNDLLKINNYKTVNAYSGTEALLVCNQEIELVLLDLMLPGKSGKEVISELKEQYNIPIIVMTAISDVDVKLDLFDLGADDYITKPFDTKELIARIKAQERHSSNINTESVLIHGNIEMNLTKYEVICNQKRLNLSKTEFELLKVLMRHPNQVLTKNNLFEAVWSGENSADDNTLNVHISKIRNKLKDADPDREYIETIWSIGYKMKN